MKYLKTYEGIIKFSESSSIPINDEITKIVSDCLNTLKIYQKENMQTIIDNVLNDIELIWTDLKDELENILSIKIERKNLSLSWNTDIDYSGFFKGLKVLIESNIRDLTQEEVYRVIETNKRCEEITESKLMGRGDNFTNVSKYTRFAYYYEFDDCINFWEKIRYNTGEELISISLHHQRSLIFGVEPKILPITWDKTLQIKEDIYKYLRPKLKEIGIAPLISSGSSVGSNGKHDTLDIKFVKLK
jgi:hypothetical protein